MPVLGLKLFCLQNPGSMTYTMPSIVMEVSAMLVAKTTFLTPSGVGSKISACFSDGSVEYIGHIFNSDILEPNCLVMS